MNVFRDLDRGLDGATFVLMVFKEGETEPFVMWPDNSMLPVPEEGEEISLVHKDKSRTEDQGEEIQRYSIEDRQMQYQMTTPAEEDEPQSMMTIVGLWVEETGDD